MTSFNLGLPFFMKPEEQMKSLSEDFKSNSKASTPRKKRSCIGRKKYSCNLCHNIFFQSESLHKHMMKHDTPIKCEYCSYTTFDNSCMNRHLVKHGICKKMYKCRHCELIFKSIVSRKQHEVSHTGVSCKLCAKVFYSISKLRTHEQDHPELNIHPCHLCDKSYPHRFMLNSHIKVSHKKVSKLGEVTYIRKVSSSEHNDHHSSLFTCQFCKKRFKHLNWLQLHEKKHVENEKSVPIEESNLFSWQKHFQTDCILCGIHITSMRHLRKHIKTVHQDAFGVGFYQNRGDCSFCGKYISPGPDNFIHAIGHLGFRPFKCHICNYKTHWIKSIKVHLGKSHSADESYTCHKCNLTFAAFQLYKKHFKESHNLEDVETGHLCHICGKSFSSTSYFKRHIKTCLNNGKKKENSKLELNLFIHGCEICSLIFETREDLQTHYLVHDNIELYSCTFCCHKFIFKRQLIDHSNNHKENLVCDDCGIEYDSYAMTMQHRKLSAVDRLCAICDYKASHGQYLSHHLKLDHNEACLQCDICHTIFASSKCYHQHLKSHSKNDSDEGYLNTKLYLPTIDSEEEDLFSIGNSFRSKKLFNNRDNYIFECPLCGETMATATQLLVHEARHKNCETIRVKKKTFPKECSHRMDLYKKSTIKNIKVVKLNIVKNSLLSYTKKEFILYKSKKNNTAPIEIDHSLAKQSTNIVLPIPEGLSSFYCSTHNNNSKVTNNDSENKPETCDLLTSEMADDNSNIADDASQTSESPSDQVLPKLVSVTNIRQVDTIDSRDIPKHSNWIELKSLPVLKPLQVSNRSEQNCDFTKTIEITSRKSSNCLKQPITIDIADDDEVNHKLFPHQPQNDFVISNNVHDRRAKEKIVIINGIRRLVTEDCGTV